MTQLPKHAIMRNVASNVWDLFSEKGIHIATFATCTMGACGGVCAIKTGTEWTREMADRAFREFLGKLK